MIFQCKISSNYPTLCLTPKRYPKHQPLQRAKKSRHVVSSPLNSFRESTESALQNISGPFFNTCIGSMGLVFLLT